MTMLSLRLPLELWVRDALEEDFVKEMRDPLMVHADQLARKVNELPSVHPGHLIDVFSFFIATRAWNAELINALSRRINKVADGIDVKGKALLLFSASHLDHAIFDRLPEASALLERLLFYFSRHIKYMELSEALMVLEALKRLSCKRRIVDDITRFHLIPKFAIISPENLFGILSSFVALDYRCSSFLKLLNNDKVMSSVTLVDLAVMSVSLDKLHQPINHFLDKISMEIRNLTCIANYDLLKRLDGLYQKHQTRNDALHSWIMDNLSAEP